RTPVTRAPNPRPNGCERSIADRRTSSFGAEQSVNLGDLDHRQRTVGQSAGLFLGLGRRSEARQGDRPGRPTPYVSKSALAEGRAPRPHPGRGDSSVRPTPYVSKGALDEGPAPTGEDIADQIDPLQPLRHPV